jgi:UDP-N-acetylglucosamine--N-acetylmuramyl-(pentapeptide) pyrophosphoryl-undecaprenol N-acetylglucosamine transferase
MTDANLRVLLAGGGSGGSATPVLAVAEQLRRLEPPVELLLVGTHEGPERALAATSGVAFAALSAGKLRRYWSARNFSDPLRVLGGLAQAVGLVRRFRPQVALGAGGFASVPPLAAAGLLRCPVHVHQQDALPGLANRLLIPFARSFSVSLPVTLHSFPRGRTSLTGNPVRPSILRGEAGRAWRRFGLDPNRPLVLVTGGGTGALGLNRLVAAAAPALVERCQVVHLTGAGRGVGLESALDGYQQHEFVTDSMADLLVAATLVVSRAGLGTLSELAALGKPALLVPMPDSHQGANAAEVARLDAALVVEQDALDPAHLAAIIHGLLADPHRLAALSAGMARVMPNDAAERLARRLLALAGRAGSASGGGSVAQHANSPPAG